MSDEPSQVQQTLMEFVSKQLLNDRPDLVLKPEDDLLSSQWVDSLGVMRIVAFLEQQFGVTIPPADVTIENFVNIQTISAYLDTRRNAIEPSVDN